MWTPHWVRGPVNHRTAAALIVLGVFAGCDGVDVLPDVHSPPPASAEDCTEPEVWFEDLDGDGYGTNAELFRTCGIPEAGWSRRRGDCDDTDDGTYPGAIEVCDGVDRDCSGVIDDATVGARVWYDDWDRDGYPDLDSEPVRQCTRPADHLSGDLPADCDDRDPDVYPGAPDAACDGIDQSCTGSDAEVARSAEGRWFGTLESALRSGSRIQVCPGVYTLDNLVVNAPIDMVGDARAPEAIVLEGTGERLLEVRGETLRIEGATLRGGRSEGDGGAILAEVDDLELRQVILEDHRAAGDGGAIAARVTEAANVSVVRAEDTVAGGNGGLLAVHCLGPMSCDAGVSGAVKNTEAGGHGGVAFIRSEAREARVGTSLQVEAIQAGGRGGVLAVEGRGDVSLRAVSLEAEDVSASDGGVLHLAAGGHAQLDVIAADLRETTVSGDGGFVRMDGVSAGLNLTASTLTGGTAARGGQLAILTSGELDLWVNGVVMRKGEAAAGASILVEGILDDDARIRLRDAEIRDQTGAPAVEIDATLRRTDPLQVEVLQGELTGNAGGGVAVPSSAEVRLYRTRLPLDRDAPNGPFDVRIGTESFTLTEAPTRSTVLTCEDSCP